MTTTDHVVPPQILSIARRFAVRDQERAAGRCEGASDRLRFRLKELLQEEDIPGCRPEDIKVISGWYRPGSPSDTWASMWRPFQNEREKHLGGVFDHTWVYLRSLGIYIDPTIAQFGEGDRGLQITSRDDPRYLRVHPKSRDKAFYYRPV
jgi:hypothetical protein